MGTGVERKDFHAEVKHLFRHIDDVGELRENALVSHLFETSRNFESERVVLVALKQNILRLASESEVEASRVGLKHEGLRRKLIIEGICFGEAPTAVARKLSLSLRQYYRARQDACLRIARLLLKNVANTSSFQDNGDLQDLLFRRARLLIDQGFADQAVSLLRDELQGAQSAAHRQAICFHLSRCLVLNGDVTQAKAMLSIAEAFEQGGGTRDGSPGEVFALRLMARLDVAISMGNTKESEELFLQIPRARLAATRTSSQEVLVELLLERSNYSSRCGNYDEAVAALKLLVGAVGMLKRIPPYLNVLVATQVALCSEYKADVPEQSLSKWDQVLVLSQSVGSARGCYYALIGLLRYYLLIESEEQAYRCLRQICEIVRSMEGPRPKVSASLAATRFIKTRFWREAGAILDKYKGLAYPGSLGAVQLQAATGQYLARNGKLVEADRVLTSALESPQATANLPLMATLLREHSLVLYRLGHTQKAKKCIKEAVVICEQSSDPLSRSETYRAATGILMDNLELRAGPEKAKAQRSRDAD